MARVFTVSMRSMEDYDTELDDVFPLEGVVNDHIDGLASEKAHSIGVIKDLIKSQVTSGHHFNYGPKEVLGIQEKSPVASMQALENHITRSRSFKVQRGSTGKNSFFTLGRSLSLKRDPGSGRVYR